MRVPAALGVKVMLAVQDAPTANENGQLVVNEKSLAFASRKRAADQLQGYGSGIRHRQSLRRALRAYRLAGEGKARRRQGDYWRTLRLHRSRRHDRKSNQDHQQDEHFPGAQSSEEFCFGIPK